MFRLASEHNERYHTNVGMCQDSGQQQIYWKENSEEMRNTQSIRPSYAKKKSTTAATTKWIWKGKQLKNKTEEKKNARKICTSNMYAKIQKMLWFTFLQCHFYMTLSSNVRRRTQNAAKKLYIIPPNSNNNKMLTSVTTVEKCLGSVCARHNHFPSFNFVVVFFFVFFSIFLPCLSTYVFECSRAKIVSYLIYIIFFFSLHSVSHTIESG